MRVVVQPASRLQPLALLERGALQRRAATALLSRLPRHVAERELSVVQQRLGWKPSELYVAEVTGALGPGNVLTLELQSERVTEIFTGFGERGTRAEMVALSACAQVERYLGAGIPVGQHLCDQLVLLLALARGGAFRTLPLDGHAETQLATIAHFLDVRVCVTSLSAEVCEMEIKT